MKVLRIFTAALTLAMALPIQAESARTQLPLESGWRFHQGDIEALSLVAPDTSNWESVAVPHTWNRVGYYLPDPQSHIHREDMINKYQGVAWYSLEFTPPADFTGKHAWLQFDAASRTAEVWLNGEKLGSHRGGFSRFRLDATGALATEQKNTLLVKVDNTVPAPKTSTADTLPLRGDFFIHGGLYRPVTLIATAPVHIDMMDAGGPGIYATTRSIDEARALVEVRTRLRNEGAQDAAVQARLRLLDAAGKVVAEETRALTLARTSGTEITATLRVDQPRLWQGTADPYLHQLQVELLSPTEEVLDRVEHAFGIREFRIDPGKGFFLNGKPLELHGVAYHQDREGRGWAVPPEEIEEDLVIMREMGANSIRLSHYQHGQVVHELADRYGFILWDEIPLVTAWTLGTEREATPELRQNAMLQLQELISQNYNHASVVTWGIANEVDFGNSMPFFLVMYKDGKVPDPMPLLRELNALAKAQDPGRPTVLATCCEGRLFDAEVEVPTTAEVTDLSGANRYFGWYYGSPEDLDAHLDTLHARRPEQPLAVTEYGAGGATSIHTDNVLGGPIDSRGRHQPEEYASYIHEQNWATLASKDYLWASWIWNAFDFATTMRKEGDANDINTKGLVTYDRKIRKDAYYFYQAHWTPAPMVYITERRYADRAYKTTPVRIYSNTPRTELLHNGESLGVRENCPNLICVWPAVTLSAGTNRLSARGFSADAVVEDVIEWHLSSDAASSIRIDSGALVAGKASGRRFGSDTYFSGGQAGTINIAANYGRPAKHPPIANTEIRDIVSTYREGDFSYQIPVQNGRYDITLSFMEPSTEAAERRFDVHANGEPVIRNLDILAQAGAPMTALTRRFSVEVSEGMLELQFKSVQGQAIVSAIEVSP